MQKSSRIRLEEHGWLFSDVEMPTVGATTTDRQPCQCLDINDAAVKVLRWYNLMDASLMWWQIVCMESRKCYEILTPPIVLLFYLTVRA